MPMKVIVCFDGVRVTVPCGDGNIPVSELINKAVHRYKRATGRGHDHWVEVASLKTISGGGILDPDDQLNDVVDDREQLIADFDEPNRNHDHIHNNGDGASSTGTTSPDVFRGRDGGLSSLPSSHHHTNSSSSSNNNTDVVITSRDLSLGSNLRVRRGSDPGLHLVEDGSKELTIKSFPGERPLIPRRESVRESDEPRSESSDDEKRLKMAAYGSLDRKRLGNRFIRDATRASLSNRTDMSRWIESQEQKANLSRRELDQAGEGKRQTITDEDGSVVCLQIDGGPLGIHAVPALDEDGGDRGLLVQSIEPGRPVHRDGQIQPTDIIVEINGTSLRNVPFIRAQEIFRSAMHSSEIHLRIVKQKTVSPTTPLPSFSPSKTRRPAPPPPLMPKPRSHTPAKPSPLTLPSQGNATSPVPIPRDSSLPRKQNEIKNQSAIGAQSQPKSNDISHSSHHVRGSSLHSSSSSSSSTQNTTDPGGTISPRQTSTVGPVIKPGPPIRPAKKVPPPAIPSRNPKTQLSSSASPETPVNLNALTNTRRIGNKIHIVLKKGPLGLGFSVTSRDNPTSGDCPIYIRNILPKGAAVQDGQLRPGDRLLQVNGQEMTGKSQSDAVSLLRIIPEGSMVELVVSRQEEVEERFKVPRPLDISGKAAIGDASNAEVKLDKRIDGKIVVPDAISSQPAHSATDLDSPPGLSQENLVFHIPLNETGSAGLGVSVKGKTQTTDSGVLKDLGIFIKTVLQGGAASKDGRLQVNDQLLEINDVHLVGLSNYSAMEAVRTAMMDDGLGQGHIKLMIARHSGGVTSQSSFEDSPNTSQGEIFPPYEISHKDNSSANLSHQRSSSTSETSTSHSSTFGASSELPSPIPPVRSQRVAALRDKFNDLGNALRNESYNRATHDSLNETGISHSVMPSPQKPVDHIHPSRLHSDGGVNERDVYTLPNKIKRPHSTIGFLYADQMESYKSGGEGDAVRHVSVGSGKDESDLSPVGDLILPFSREGFGRQSMSEKRKGHLDPRSTEVYKQAKANKENKGGFLNRRVRSFHVTGLQEAYGTNNAPKVHEMASEAVPNPSMMHASTYQPSQPRPDVPQSNLKRTSSMEDLANVPSSEAPRPPIPPSGRHQVRGASPSWQMNRFGRARACNESFRAAVDRSYEVMDPTLMDTLEEESLESSMFAQEPSFSGRSSISSENTTEDNNSLKRSKVKDKEKKGGLLKGFLRFGKGRKSSEDAMRRSRSEERSSNHTRKDQRQAEHSTDRSSNRVLNDRWAQSVMDGATGPELGFYPVAEYDKERRRRASQQENDRVEDEYARLRAHHLAEQRQRSQSVDPSIGREASGERSSPFQPYVKHVQQGTHSLGRNNGDARYIHPSASPHEIKAHNPPAVSGHHNHIMHPQEGKSSVAKAVMSRAEKIQQLRSMYQQRHRQRKGVYPLDDAEELYERQIQEMEQHQWMYSESIMYVPSTQPYKYPSDRDQQERPSVSLPSNTKELSATTYPNPHTSLSGYRHASSHPQSRNNSAESVPYNQQDASYFYQHPSHHQHLHPHSHHHPDTFYHSDQQEITSFSNTLESYQDYHRGQVCAMDNESHPFYQNRTQFHPGQGVPYRHYQTNTSHSDSAKV